MKAPTPLRLLLLEDEPDDADLVLAELRRAEFVPISLRVETEADYLAALSPALDLVLADFRLPQFDAWRALALLKQHQLDVPFIVVSGAIGEDVAVAIVREGAADYLLKDRLTRLGPAVRQALARRALRQDKERAEAALAASEAHFRALIENAADMVAILDPRGIVRYVSPGIERILGYPPSEWLGTLGFAHYHPEDLPRAQAFFAEECAAPGSTAATELRARHQDGSWRWIEAVVTNLIADPNVGGVVINARDVTERRRIEELRQIAAEHASLLAVEREYTQTLEQLSILRAEFSAMVAHELGSRIAAIRRCADVLAIDPLSADQTSALATIQTEVTALRTLIADAQAAATIERDDFVVRARPVPIRTLLSEAAAFARTLPGEHSVAVECESMAKVHADADRIGQVLRNLLDNAAKYSLPRTPIMLQATAQGDRVRIEVTDKGFGIHSNDLHRIFEKFGRGHEPAIRAMPGVGLGLYLSRRITQAHGTDLTVESTPGQGSTFGFELEVVG